MKYEPDDGTERIFRYCEDGGSGLAKAAMTQSLAGVANWTEQAMSAYTAAVGDQTIQITLATTLTANILDDGWLVIVDGASEAAALGDFYMIKSHTTGTTPVLTLADDGGIRTVLTATAEVSVIPNKFKDVVTVPAAAGTSIPCGVPLVDFTADYFGWVQTRGPAPLLIDNDTVVVGDQVGEPATTNTAGGAGIHAVTFPIYGKLLAKATNGQTDQPGIVFLTLE